MTRTQAVPSSSVDAVDLSFQHGRNVDSSSSSSSPSRQHKRIDADLLIPGRGKPIEQAALIYEPAESPGGSGRIVYAGSNDAVPVEYSTLDASEHVPVLMPGLWDCHVHYMGLTSTNLESLVYENQSLPGFRSARDVFATLNAGFTSVREVGGFGVDIYKAIDDGWIPGPRIYSAGACLSQTAGHADLHGVPLPHLHDCMEHGLPLALADGVDEAIKQVRKQIRRGAKVIKICSTGGVMSKIDSPRAAQFTTAELAAIVEEATRTNLAVASHAHGTQGILAALHAGALTIEHGSYLTKEAIDLMLEKKAMLVATRHIQETGVKKPEFLPPDNYKKLLETVKVSGASYSAAIKAGVKCALGTDLGVSSVAVDFLHGTNGIEFYYAVKAGMTPLEAIEAGTANGPDTLGPQAPLSGQLKKGYDADFIAVAKDPVKDIEVLAEPKHITHVWKGGKLLKAPGKPLAFMDESL